MVGSWSKVLRDPQHGRLVKTHCQSGPQPRGKPTIIAQGKRVNRVSETVAPGLALGNFQPSQGREGIGLVLGLLVIRICDPQLDGLRTNHVLG